MLLQFQTNFGIIDIICIIFQKEKNLPMKANETVKKESLYIAYFCTLLSVLMQVVFIVCRKWDYTVLLGNLLSLSLAVLNFYFMGITVQKAVLMDEADARKLMKSSSAIRNAVVFLVIVIGVVLPIFNTVSVFVPVFFPRIAVIVRSRFIKD